MKESSFSKLLQRIIGFVIEMIEAAFLVNRNSQSITFWARKKEREREAPCLKAKENNFLNLKNKWTLEPSFRFVLKSAILI